MRLEYKRDQEDVGARGGGGMGGGFSVFFDVSRPERPADKVCISGWEDEEHAIGSRAKVKVAPLRDRYRVAGSRVQDSTNKLDMACQD